MSRETNAMIEALHDQSVEIERLRKERDEARAEVERLREAVRACQTYGGWPQVQPGSYVMIEAGAWRRLRKFAGGEDE